MKEKFVKAELEIIRFETEDVIRTSGDELPGIEIDLGSLDPVEP